MTDSKSSCRTTSSSKAATADLLTLLFHEPTIDIANRLNTLLETERKPQYQCHDYLEATATNTASNDSCYSTSINSNADSSRIRRLSSMSSSSINNNNNKKKIVTPTARSKIIFWLNDCVDYLEVSRECVAVAMSYVDRVMSSSTINTAARHHLLHRHLKNSIIHKAREDVTIYQLLSLSALYIAIKQFATLSLSSSSSSNNHNRVGGGVIIDVNALVRLSHGSYTSSEITDMETNILNILDWHICDVTAWSVSLTVIGLLSKTLRHTSENKKRIVSVVDFTRLQVELSVSDYSTSVLCPSSSSSSVVAFGAIMNSLDLLDFTKKEKHAFQRVMYNYTNVDLGSSDIEKMSNELQYVFDTRSDSVMERSSSSSCIRSDNGDDDKNNKRKDSRKKKKSRSPRSISSSKSPVCVDTDIYETKKQGDKQKKSSSSSSSRRINSQGRRIPLEP